MAECKPGHELPVVAFQNAQQQQHMHQYTVEPTESFYEPTASTWNAGFQPLPAQSEVATAENVYQYPVAIPGSAAPPRRSLTDSQVPANSAPNSKKRWICLYALITSCLVMMVIVGAVAIHSLLKSSESGPEKIVGNQNKILEEQLKIGKKLDKQKKDLLYRMRGATCIGVNGNNIWNSSIGSKIRIYPPGLDKGVDVYCDSSDGGGWIVLQYRSGYGSVNFDVSSDYANGFGNEQDYWIGLDKIHNLTLDAEYELRIDLEDWCGKTAYAAYSNFRIGNARENYILSISEYSGTAGDSLASSDGRKFTTSSQSYNYYCSSRSRSGGWWFDVNSYCFTTNLNGRMYSRSSLYYPYYYSYYYSSNQCSTRNPTCNQCLRSSSSYKYGIFWSGFGGGPGVLKVTKMRMRLKPASFD